MEDEFQDDYVNNPPPPPACIGTLIDKAVGSKSEKDLKVLFDNLNGRVLYLKTAEHDSNEIPITSIDGGMDVFVLFTSAWDERLTHVYGGTKWEVALQMLIDIQIVDALKIQSSISPSFICVQKEKAQSLFLTSQQKATSVSY